MKKIAMMVLAMILVLICFSVNISAKDVSVKLNGKELEFVQPPVIVESRTLVPLRAIFEALGATVDWNDATKTVTAKRADVTIKLTIGSDVLYKNEEKIKLDVPAQIMGIGYTMVPARAVAESFGVIVDWDDETKTVLLYSFENVNVKNEHKKLVEHLMSEGEYADNEYFLRAFWNDADGNGHWISVGYSVDDDEVYVSYTDPAGCVFMLVFDDMQGPHMFFEGDETNGTRLVYGEIKTGISLSERGSEAVNIMHFTINDDNFTDSAELMELSRKWIGLGSATAILLADNILFNGTEFSIAKIYNLTV